MRRLERLLVVASMTGGLGSACARSRKSPPPPVVLRDARSDVGAESASPSAKPEVSKAELMDPPERPSQPPPPPAQTRVVPFDTDRSAFVVLPRDPKAPARLLAMLHGVCVPPEYVCGGWKSTAASAGVLVCPSGNATCGPDGTGGPTWEEPFAAIDTDLERSIAAARREIAPPVSRKGAILAGFSRGAYAAVILAVRHPGRWPFLILNEADVDLTLPMVQEAGVRAVAMIAGEWSAQVESERKTAQALAATGFPVRLWIMPKVGHAYSPDIESIMREAVEYLLSHEAPAEGDAHHDTY